MCYGVLRVGLEVEVLNVTVSRHARSLGLDYDKLALALPLQKSVVVIHTHMQCLVSVRTQEDTLNHGRQHGTVMTTMPEHKRSTNKTL